MVLLQQLSAGAAEWLSRDAEARITFSCGITKKKEGLTCSRREISGSCALKAARQVASCCGEAAGQEGSVLKMAAFTLSNSGSAASACATDGDVPKMGEPLQIRCLCRSAATLQDITDSSRVNAWLTAGTGEGVNQLD